MSCLNCGNLQIGKYCSNCGQKAIAERLNLFEWKNDLAGTILNYESKLFRTVFGLVVKPRQVVEDYLKGKRKSFFNPIKLLFIALTIKTILEVKMSEGKTQAYEFFSFLQSDYWKVLMVIVFMPVLSLQSYLLFKKYNYNFSEHLAINSYFIAVTSIVAILIYLPKVLFNLNYESGTWALVVDLFVFVWLYANLFRRKIYFSIPKAVGIYVVGFTLLGLPLLLYHLFLKT